jgi:hypothetical protein
MRINNLHVSGLVIGAATQIPERDVGRAEPAEKTAVDAGLHIRSLELSRWIALAQGEPEILADVVERVASLLIAGGYFTPESAAQTAEAILNAME